MSTQSLLEMQNQNQQKSSTHFKVAFWVCPVCLPVNWDGALHSAWLQCPLICVLPSTHTLIWDAVFLKCCKCGTIIKCEVFPPGGVNSGWRLVCRKRQSGCEKDAAGNIYSELKWNPCRWALSSHGGNNLLPLGPLLNRKKY